MPHYGALWLAILQVGEMTMNIYVNSSPNGATKVVTVCHDSGNGKATMWVINSRSPHITYTGPAANADDLFRALTEWLAENGIKE